MHDPWKATGIGPSMDPTPKLTLMGLLKIIALTLKELLPSAGKGKQ